MKNLFFYSFLNALSLIPGLLFVFGGKYFLNDGQFVEFVKEKTIIILIISCLSMGLSQVATYLRSYKFNLKNIMLHIQIFHFFSIVLIFIILLILKFNKFWFFFLDTQDCLIICLISFFLLSNSEMLNTFRITNRIDMFSRLIILRVILSIAIYLIFYNYLYTLAVTEVILYLIFYKNDFLKNFKNFFIKKLLIIFKKGLPFLFVISLSPILLFIIKYSLGSNLLENKTLIGDYELLFSIYNLIVF